MTLTSIRSFRANMSFCQVSKYQIDIMDSKRVYLKIEYGVNAAGNFPAFQVFYIKNEDTLMHRRYLFFMDPKRIKMKVPATSLQKFSLQDATLAAPYAQLAASALGLSTIWIGMFDEEKIKSILNTDLQPSSILCAGYPVVRRLPRPRRKLNELTKVIH